MWPEKANLGADYKGYRIPVVAGSLHVGAKCHFNQNDCSHACMHVCCSQLFPQRCICALFA